MVGPDGSGSGAHTASPSNAHQLFHPIAGVLPTPLSRASELRKSPTPHARSTSCHVHDRGLTTSKAVPGGQGHCLEALLDASALTRAIGIILYSITNFLFKHSYVCSPLLAGLREAMLPIFKPGQPGVGKSNAAR